MPLSLSEDSAPDEATSTLDEHGKDDASKPATSSPDASAISRNKNDTARAARDDAAVAADFQKLMTTSGL